MYVQRAVGSTAFKGPSWAGKGCRSVRLSEVRRLCVGALQRAGLERADAVFTADTLLDKDLQGDHLRGVCDVPRWVSLFRTGQADPRPRLRILRETRNSALIGEDPTGFYLSIARQSMALCIQKAKGEGIAIVGVRKNLGTLAPLLKIATASRLIALGTIQGPPSIAPTGGKRPLVGNNPVGVGIPAGGLDPVILDMALSQISATPVFAAAARGQELVPGLLLDREGRPTTDPRAFARAPEPERRGELSQYLASRPGAFAAGGSLVPVGGYKGYALALAFGLLTSALLVERPSEAARDGAWYAQHPGSLLIAIDPSLFCPPAEFSRGVERELLRVIRSPRTDGVRRLFYPGRRSQELQAKGREEDLVPLPAGTRRDLERLAKALDIPADLRIVR